MDAIVGLDCLFPVLGASPSPFYTPGTFPLNDEATVFFTTGSTGRPKMVINSFRAILLLLTKRVQMFLQYTPSSLSLSLNGYEDSGSYNLNYIPSLLADATILLKSEYVLSTSSACAAAPLVAMMMVTIDDACCCCSMQEVDSKVSFQSCLEELQRVF
jgi:acyl-CoA synthetase (AMP-forming)/AMP-acid ligase II